MLIDFCKLPDQSRNLSVGDFGPAGVPQGHFFYEMLCEIVILIFDMKIDSNLISFFIFDLRFPFILILICDVKRGLNANFNY